MRNQVNEQFFLVPTLKIKISNQSSNITSLDLKSFKFTKFNNTLIQVIYNPSALILLDNRPQYRKNPAANFLLSHRSLVHQIPIR